jgi:hypothetical protein
MMVSPGKKIRNMFLLSEGPPVFRDPGASSFLGFPAKKNQVKSRGQMVPVVE